MLKIYDEFIDVKEKMDNIYDEILAPLKENQSLHINMDILIKEYKKKNILVTGGAGSVGSELCRQLLLLNAKSIIIYDIYENASYMLYQELLLIKEKFNSNSDIKVIIGDVSNIDSLNRVFENNKIDYVFHAAAHKHVPLMEEVPLQAIKTNCIGSYNVMKLSKQYKVSKVLLISTDKAINPLSVMGASKRLAEIIFNSFDINHYCVRFGNVFNSSGSVIPIFIKQILTNKKITLTSKQATRYFMSIKEAVLLILQAMTLESKKTYVLDMGKQISMELIAIKTIEFFNMKANEDVIIEEIGLRKGEKIKEEEINYSLLDKTSSNNIYCFKDESKKHITNIIDFLNNIEKSKNIKEELLLFINKNDVD